MPLRNCGRGQSRKGRRKKELGENDGGGGGRSGRMMEEDGKERSLLRGGEWSTKTR